MKLPWGRKLPAGDALEAEAERLGVSLYDIYKTKDGLTYLDEPELQRRVMAARAERRGATLNIVQTVGIIGTLVLTLILAAWNHRAQEGEERTQAKRESADLMLKFDGLMNSDGSGLIGKELDREGNLDHIKLSGQALDDALDDFLSDYEDLDTAWRNHLIDDDTAYDAFSYDLEKALKDAKVRDYLARSRREEGDLWDGVLELARAWKIGPALPALGAGKAGIAATPIPSSGNH